MANRPVSSHSFAYRFNGRIQRHLFHIFFSKQINGQKNRVVITTRRSDGALCHAIVLMGASFAYQGRLICISSVQFAPGN